MTLVDTPSVPQENPVAWQSITHWAPKILQDATHTRSQQPGFHASFTHCSTCSLSQHWEWQMLQELSNSTVASVPASLVLGRFPTCISHQSESFQGLLRDASVTCPCTTSAQDPSEILAYAPAVKTSFAQWPSGLCSRQTSPLQFTTG